MPALSPARLRVRELTKRYGAVEAVGGLSFEVAAGEIFGLLGPNGAGKTTTLECILGLIRPDAGEIQIGEIDALAHPEAAKQVLGAQLQSASLQDKITPREALHLFSAFYSQPVSVDALIEQFSLGEKADAAFDSLSGGQKQRLFLALAFVNHPSVVILDEPTVGLDPRARRELHETIVHLRDAGQAVLLSTHYLNEAHQLCDRVGIIDHGRIVALGTPTELIEKSRALPRLFLRTASPAPSRLIDNVPGVTLLRRDGDTLLLRSSEITSTVARLATRLQAEKIDLLDLQILRPSLEDVFLEVTGRTYSPTPDKVGGVA